MSDLWRREGAAAAMRGDAREAAVAFAKAAAGDPADLLAWSNLSAAGLELGALAAAEAAARRALTLRSDQAAAWNNLGTARQRQGRPEAARLAHAASLAADPAGAMAWLNLGVDLRAADNDARAASAYSRALVMAPDWSQAAINLGNALAASGEREAAVQAYSRAARHGNEGALRLKSALLLPIVAESMEEIAAARLALAATIEDLAASPFTLADPLAEIGQTAFHLAYHNEGDRDLQQALAGLYLKAAPDLGWVAPHVRAWRGAQSARLRIAIVSELLHQHTIGRLFQGLIAELDRQRFEVIVVSPRRPEDPVRAAINASADRWVALPDRLSAARETIAGIGADILLYPDIGMTPLTYFLAFARLAPIQAVHWGHPDTTGIPNLDIFISASAMEPPDAAQDYSERLFSLPGPTLCVARPERIPAVTADSGTLYLCPQAPQKLHPDFDAVIAAILRADEAGRCILVVGASTAPGRRLAARFHHAAPDIADRIVMIDPMPREKFQSLLASASVMLDPLHYSGGHTSLEAFAAGTPIVTWPGRFMRGRHTFGFYRLMDICEGIAADAEDYAHIATTLANDRDRRRDFAEAIEANCGALFERADAADRIGDALAQALENHSA